MEDSKLVFPTKDIYGNYIPYDTLYIPYIYKEIQIDKIYDGLLYPDMVIVDIGANMGITVEHFQPFARKLYAIEPSPEYFMALSQNKELFKWDNVELFNFAMADHDGEMPFASNMLNRTMNTLVVDDLPLIQANGYIQGMNVQTRAIDSFFDEHEIDEVDFMKLDTEGAEELILRSDGFKNIAPRIKVFEAEFHRPDWPNLVEYVISLGFDAQAFKSLGNVVLFRRIN